jgi:hypothetical protein
VTGLPARELPPRPLRGARWVFSLIVLVAVVALVLIAADRRGGFSVRLPVAEGNGEVAVDDERPPLIINQGSVQAMLYPGGPPQTLSGTFTNSGTTPVAVAAVTATLGIVAGGRGSCGPDSFELDGPVMTVDRQIPVGVEVGSWGGASIRMVDTSSDQDGCQAAHVRISYTAR